MSKIIVLSQPITDDMPVYPGDAKTSLVQTKFLESDYHNNHRLEISMHTGTHIDGPMHLMPCKEYISEIPLAGFIGRGCILDVRGQSVISLRPEYENQVKQNSILLLYTGQDSLYGNPKYYEGPGIELDLCELIVRKNVTMVGMDMPSPDKYPFPVHKELMEQGIFILENLTNLSQLLNVEFEVIALPLKIRADGSITRAVARILE